MLMLADANAICRPAHSLTLNAYPNAADTTQRRTTPPKNQKTLVILLSYTAPAPGPLPRHAPTSENRDVEAEVAAAGDHIGETPGESWGSGEGEGAPHPGQEQECNRGLELAAATGQEPGRVRSTLVAGHRPLACRA